jgi:hypothetical protein
VINQWQRYVRLAAVSLTGMLLYGCAGNGSVHGSVYYGVGYGYGRYDPWYRNDVIVRPPANRPDRPSRPDRPTRPERPVRPTPLPARPIPRPAPRGRVR